MVTWTTLLQPDWNYFELRFNFAVYTDTKWSHLIKCVFPCLNALNQVFNVQKALGYNEASDVQDKRQEKCWTQNEVIGSETLSSSLAFGLGDGLIDISFVDLWFDQFRLHWSNSCFTDSFWAFLTTETFTDPLNLLRSPQKSWISQRPILIFLPSGNLFCNLISPPCHGNLSRKLSFPQTTVKWPDYKTMLQLFSYWIDLDTGASPSNWDSLFSLTW